MEIMRRNRLGQSGLIVSSLGLGTMTFGSQVDETCARQIMDRAFEGGINFFDTAEMYSSPSRPETYGKAEEILGRWVNTKPRDAIIVATKVVGAADWRHGAPLSHIRGGTFTLDRHHIIRAAEASLKRMGLEWIDLYQTHWPDRLTPIDEQLEAMERLIEAGKIRYFGTSNETPWGLTRMCAHAHSSGVPGPVSVQNAYNLLQRHFELGLDEACRHEGVGMIAFSPLAMGLLTGKYSGETRPQEARLTQFARYGSMYLQTRMIGCADTYVDVARAHDLCPIEMAFAWTASRLGVAAVLTSCSRLQQLEPYLRSADLELPAEVLLELDRVRADHDARWNLFG
jgi:aryl-alcohol dehydrogenase-like predicted oxidoreductase